jgi:hypothetical protein
MLHSTCEPYEQLSTQFDVKFCVLCPLFYEQESEFDFLEDPPPPPE